MPVPMTGNGRMSEAQAALALLSLEDYPRNRALNQERFKLYLSRLDDLNGIRLICPEPGDSSNYQHVVAEIDAEAFGLSRDVIVRILEAENIRCSHYPYGGIHRCEPYRSRYPENLEAFPSTDTVCARFMQLPTGQHVTTEDINAICDIIAYVYENAGHIRTRLRRAG
jgi:dTDP-4-amino-4,6-dideoxygalactose transaminase